MSLPPILIEIKALGNSLSAGVKTAKGELSDLESTGNKHMAGLQTAGKTAALGVAAVGIAAIAVGVETTKMAAGFQESTTQLITGAGESEKNIDMVRKGILAMAGAVGTMPEQLSKGMYLIESAGYHGAQGLSVLRAAAEGAKVGGADMATVAGALTTALTDYNIPASRSNAVTSALVQTVASGKMHMEDLARSLGMVMPKASALGVSFQDVTGALATMTAAGMTARRASMNLSSTIVSLGAPSKGASDALKNIGLSAQQVKDDMSKKGLAGTLEEIEDHVGNKFPKGSVAGVQALKAILGGTTGYGTALALTGTHMKAFEANTKSIGSALNGQNKNVQGFALTQKDLAFQVQQAKASAEALGIRIGTLLIPVIQKIIPMISNMVLWLIQHKTIALVLAGIIGGVMVAAMTAWVVGLVASSTALGTVATTLGLVDAAGAPLIGTVVLIIAGIALLVAGLIYAYNHFQTFHDIVNTVFAGIKVVIGAVVDWFTQTAMPAITAAWTVVWGVLQAAWDNVGQPLFAFIGTAIGLWWDGAKIVFGFLTDAWNVVWALVSAAWTNVGAPLFAFIGTAVGLWWDAMKVVFDLLTGAWDLVWFLVTTAWNVVGKPLFDLVVAVVKVWWGDVKVVWDLLSAAWGVLWGGIQMAWNLTGKPIFDGIGTVVSFLWNDVLKPVFSFIVGGFLALVGAFIDGAARAFGWIPGLGPKLQAAARDFDTFRDHVNNAIHGVNGQNITVGVKFAANGGSSSVVPGILTHGSVSGGGGGGGLPSASSQPGPFGHALGGLISGGIKGQDSVLGLLMPEEYVVRADGSNLREAIHHFGGVRGYANGGLVVNTSIPTAADISSAVNAGFNSFANGVDFSGMAASAAASFSGGGGGGAGGAAQWASTVLAVLAALGQPSSLLAGVLRLINKESSGNARAINLTDSNAMKGTPSMGLIQTIMSTFLANAGPYAALGPYNPFANIYAGLNHAISAWGSIAAVDPLVHVGGYALGTTNAAAGPHWVGEGGQPELLSFGGGETVTPKSQLGGGFDYNKLAAALVSAMGGVSVTMDGRVVGALVNTNNNDLRRNGVTRIK